jgi:hypothetical protein
MEPAGGDEDLGPPSAQMYDHSLHTTLSPGAVRYVHFTSICDVDSAATLFRCGSKPVQLILL